MISLYFIRRCSNISAIIYICDIFNIHLIHLSDDIYLIIYIYIYKYLIKMIEKLTILNREYRI